MEQDTADWEGSEWREVRLKRGLSVGIANVSHSVVQRQMYLMDNHNMTKQQAYDQARSELYAERLKEDVERRVAREEATHVGAQFGKDRITIGMELEDKAYESWRVWADKEVTAREQMRIAGTAVQDSTSVDAPEAELEELEAAPEQAQPASENY